MSTDNPVFDDAQKNADRIIETVISKMEEPAQSACWDVRALIRPFVMRAWVEGQKAGIEFARTKLGFILLIVPSLVLGLGGSLPPGLLA